MENNLIPSQTEITTLEKIGEYAVKSGYLPNTIKNAQQAVIIALKGKELGIPPMQAFAQIAVVQGKPTISAELMMSLVYKNVQGAEIVFKQNDDKACVIHARRQSSHEFAIFSFTMDDAKKADLLSKEVWKKYPQSMLRARCISAMCRALFPDAIAGASYTAEELEGTSTINVTAQNIAISRKNDLSAASNDLNNKPVVIETSAVKIENKENIKMASSEQINELKTLLIKSLGYTVDDAVQFMKTNTGKTQTSELTDNDAQVLISKAKEIIASNPQTELLK